MTPRPPECTVCGAHSNLRPEGHAEWCERVTALLLAGTGHAAKTHCPKGHPYDEENTYVGKRGRYCRACQRAWAAANRDARNARRRAKWRANHPTSASTPSSHASAGVVEEGANGAVGRSGDLVGEVKAAAPAAPTKQTATHAGVAVQAPA